MFHSVTALAIAAAATLGLSSSSFAQGKAAGTIVQVASGDPQFSTLVAAVKAAGLADALSGPGPFTVFAPTNDAFAKLPTGTVETLLKPENKDKLANILKYHVVSGSVMGADAMKLPGAITLQGQRLDLTTSGSSLMVDSAKVIKADIKTSNGVIHVIDSVVMPSEANLAATAEKAGMFKTLLAAAKAAGLADALAGGGGDSPLTVLAPTDEAFAKLPAGTLDTLLKPENKEALATILKLHIIAGRVYSEQALKMGAGKTLSGESVTFALTGGKAMVNNARLLKTDIDASNGVVHVIDTVLLPAQMPKLSAIDAMPAAVNPARIAELAIDRGVPMYNRGDHDACAAVYEVATRALLSSDGLSCDVRNRLMSAWTTAQAEPHAGRKAWALRHGLDAVMEQDRMAAR